MENLVDREFRGLRLKTMKRLFNYGQKTNPFVFFMIRWNSRSIDFSIQNRGKNFENRELFSNQKQIWWKLNVVHFLIPKPTNPSQKIWTFIENRKVRQLFRFSYKTAKTPKSRNALTSLNTWIWRLTFGMGAQNESYFMLFIFIFWYERKSLERDQPSVYV
jgi:hypothetical protein